MKTYTDAQLRAIARAAIQTNYTWNHHGPPTTVTDDMELGNNGLGYDAGGLRDLVKELNAAFEARECPINLGLNALDKCVTVADAIKVAKDAAKKPKAHAGNK